MNATLTPVIDSAPATLAPAEENPAVAYLSSLSPIGRRGMATALDGAARRLSANLADLRTYPWGTLRFQHVQYLRAELSKTKAPATVNHLLAGLKGTARAAWDLRQMSSEELLRIERVKGPSGTTLLAGRALEPEELAALFDACDPNTAIGARNSSLLGILFGAGLRRSEVVALDLSDLNPDTGELAVRSAKGGKQRTVYLAGGALRAARNWLSIRGDTPGPLLLPTDPRGVPIMRRLTDNSILMTLGRLRKRSGIKHLSPHDCRRTFCSSAIEATGDLLAVQSLMGQASLNVTKRYDRRGEKAKRRVAEALCVPYHEAR